MRCRINQYGRLHRRKVIQACCAAQSIEGRERQLTERHVRNCLHISMHHYQRLEIDRDGHNHILQCTWRERKELRHTEQRFRMGASAFFLSQRKHGVHACYCHAEELLSVSGSRHQRKGKAAEENKH